MCSSDLSFVSQSRYTLYKDKPPATNTGNATINFNSTTNSISSNYTVGKTNEPNVQAIYNSSGQKIATITTNYKLTDGTTVTRRQFADHTTIDYSGKNTQIGFDAKGNVTSVSGDNANVILNGKTTPITIAGNNTSTTLLGNNKEVNIKGDGS